MRTKVTGVEELKRIFLQEVINNTNKVSKISKFSVLSGVGFGVAKVGQKALKEAAIVEARKFPHAASGIYLDMVAEDYGIAPRFSASASSVYICLMGDVGTVYTISQNTFTGSHGVEFIMDNDVTIGNAGYEYVKVRSTTVGESTNVDPYTITDISNAPIGHQKCFNDMVATGGRDEEDDDTFRNRIIEGVNILARNTQSSLEQALMRINSDVLRVYYYGITDSGKIRIGVLAQNGMDFTQAEFDDMLSRSEEMFAWSDSRFYGATSYGVEFVNIDWMPIDIDFRVRLNTGYNADVVRKELQIAASHYIDYRFWSYPRKVEWDDILMIVKSHMAVSYVSDADFLPRQDIFVPKDKLPRIRKFRMRDLGGNLISDFNGVITLPNSPSPYADIYFGNEKDKNYLETVINSI